MSRHSYRNLPSSLLLLLYSGCLIGCSGENHGSGSNVEAVGNELNIILVVMDTCRQDGLGAYGSDSKSSPYLDRFAEEAVVFTNCLAQSTATAPSHRSLFTGQYVHRHQNDDNGQALETPYTLASLFQSQGWPTAAFLGGGSLLPSFGFGQGFDVYETMSKSAQVKNKGTLVRSVEAASNWLNQKPAPSKPFFLFIHGYDPHCPYWPPEPYRTKFAGWYQGDLPARNLCGKRDFDRLIRDHLLEDEDRRYVQDLYKGGIASGDEALGRFFEELRSMELLDRSIIIFTSDHGESLGEHDFIGHTLMWEEQLKIPLMIRFPHGKWAGINSFPTQHVDLLPTILAALGWPLPPGVQGRELLTPIRNPQSTNPPRMRISRYANFESIRFENRWKITIRQQRGKPQEYALYDLLEDPEENRNLYPTEEGKRRFGEIHQQYLDWRQETAAEDASFRPRNLSRDRIITDMQALQELGYSIGDEEEE